jgi:hypothetical protein
MVKVVTFFLIGMMVLALFGKLRMPSLPTIKRRKTIETARKCNKCGAYKIGKNPCVCGKKK